MSNICFGVTGTVVKNSSEKNGKGLCAGGKNKRRGKGGLCGTRV